MPKVVELTPAEFWAMTPRPTLPSTERARQAGMKASKPLPAKTAMVVELTPPEFWLAKEARANHWTRTSSTGLRQLYLKPAPRPKTLVVETPLVEPKVSIPSRARRSSFQ